MGLVLVEAKHTEEHLARLTKRLGSINIQFKNSDKVEYFLSLISHRVKYFKPLFLLTLKNAANEVYSTI